MFSGALDKWVTLHSDCLLRFQISSIQRLSPNGYLLNSPFFNFATVKTKFDDKYVYYLEKMKNLGFHS
jgi:hypothetical protein